MNILLIKLGALGDVLRTTPLLKGLKAAHPSCRLTWLVEEKCLEVLEGNALIDELLPYSGKNIDDLSKRTFDLLINLDKENEALEAVKRVPALKKMGFGWLPSGEMGALDRLSEYAVRLGVDDELKFRQNKKTYQEISFEQVGLRFDGEEYVFSLDESSLSFARRHLHALGIDLKNRRAPIVGLNTGSGHRFAGKQLPVATYCALAGKLSEELGATVCLLGGRDEAERNREIAASAPCPVINTGSHSIRRFAALVKQCDVIVSGDTTAMHIAIAVKTPVVVHFGSTCAAEIELYGLGIKIISSIECAPCYKRVCPIDNQCMKDMRVGEIFSAVRKLIKRSSITYARINK